MSTSTTKIDDEVMLSYSQSPAIFLASCHRRHGTRRQHLLHVLPLTHKSKFAGSRHYFHTSHDEKFILSSLDGKTGF